MLNGFFKRDNVGCFNAIVFRAWIDTADTVKVILMRCEAGQAVLIVLFIICVYVIIYHCAALRLRLTKRKQTGKFTLECREKAFCRCVVLAVGTGGDRVDEAVILKQILEGKGHILTALIALNEDLRMFEFSAMVLHHHFISFCHQLDIHGRGFGPAEDLFGIGVSENTEVIRLGFKIIEEVCDICTDDSARCDDKVLMDIVLSRCAGMIVRGLAVIRVTWFTALRMEVHFLHQACNSLTADLNAFAFQLGRECAGTGNVIQLCSDE